MNDGKQETNTSKESIEVHLTRRLGPVNARLCAEKVVKSQISDEYLQAFVCIHSLLFVSIACMLVYLSTFYLY